MLTPRKLFIKRLVSAGKFQVDIWRTTVDWVIGIYIVIPIVIAFGVVYTSMWNPDTGWSSHVPFVLVVMILFVLTWIGSFREYFVMADQLFLVQQNGWMKALKRLAHITQSVKILFSVSLMIGVFLPLLRLNFDFSTFQIGLLGSLLFIFKYGISVTKKQLFLKYSGWRRIVFTVFSFGLSGILFGRMVQALEGGQFTVVSIGLAGVILFLMFIIRKDYFLVRGEFPRLAAYENDRKVGTASLLLGSTGVVEQKSIFGRKNPLLFKKSRPLFKQRTTVNILAENHVKAFFRKPSHLRIYGQLIGVGMYAIFAVSVVIKWLVWFGLLLLLYGLCRFYWKEAQASSFFQMLPWSWRDEYDAQRKSIYLMMLPGFILYTLSMGIGIWLFG